MILADRPRRSHAPPRHGRALEMSVNCFEVRSSPRFEAAGVPPPGLLTAGRAGESIGATDFGLDGSIFRNESANWIV